ncbi:MAG: nucleotide sugar dehydrogenase [Candidatus Omnitrophica bacterium]|nr:nucleotide sugar dehydrogenase [Candidatus Omnitrophota bacterium]
MYKKLFSKIKKNEISVAVIGLGYVGLPLALGFANKGFRVYGIDNNTDRIDRLLAGTSYITDVTDAEIVEPVSHRAFLPTTDFGCIKNCRAVIICVPTPIKKKYTPDISFILSAVRSVAENLSKGTLVILESTTYPGTTEELIAPELERGGLKVGRDFYLAFSPERIDPGNATHTVTQIPKVVGGVTPACSILAKALYGKIIKDIHVVSSPRAAEMCKLLENTFRLVNIGWINEAAMMCHKFDIDVWEVIDAAKTKPFGFMPFYPGLGVGGHCIPEDPIYLYWKAKEKGCASRFIKLSADINSAMPEYVVSRVKDMLSARGKILKGARVLIMGVTYKKDVKDLRKSPSLRLIDILKRRGAVVSFYDPLVPFLHLEGLEMEGAPLTPKNIADQDCVVIAVDHTNVDYKLVLKNARQIFDLKNIYHKTVSEKIIKL